MLKFMKTIDVAVADRSSLERSVAAWEKLLGFKAIHMKPEYSPPGGVDAYHVPMPTGTYACHAIGVFMPTGDNGDNPVGGRILKEFIRDHGEAAFLLSFMVDDTHEAQRWLEAKGFTFFYREPLRYAAGTHNFMWPTPELQGIWVHICRHDEGGLARWREGREQEGKFADVEMGLPESHYR